MYIQGEECNREREWSAEGKCADVSADAERSALLRTCDAELLNFRLEGGPFHGQTSRRAVAAAEHPPGFAEDAEDVVPFGVGEGDGWASEPRRRGGIGLQVAEVDVQRRARRE